MTTTCPIHARIVEFVDSVADDKESRTLTIAGLLWKLAERVPDIMAEVIDESALEIAALGLEHERETRKVSTNVDILAPITSDAEFDEVVAKINAECAAMEARAAERHDVADDGIESE